MANRYGITLTESEREYSSALGWTSKTTPGDTWMLESLLLCDVGEHAPSGEAWKVADVASALGIGVAPSKHQEALRGGWVGGRLGRKPRTGPPRVTFDGAFDARGDRLGALRPPDGRARPTRPFLADKVVELKIAPVFRR